MLPIYTEVQAKEATLNYFNGDELATDMVVGKYLLKDRDGNLRELTPPDMYKRMAKEFARVEKGFNINSSLSESEILNYFENQIILPQGSPTYGIGNDFQLSSLSNCVVVASPEDSISGIMETGRELANLFKRRCGVGVDISSLRPEDAQVSNSAGTSTGAWSFADLFSYICRLIGQNGRRGALMITMDIRHPDAERFIEMKQDKSKVTGANVSVKLTDEFMAAVESDSEFTQQWPCEGVPQVTKVIRARELWDKLVKAATESAEPGLLLWDNCTKYLPAERYGNYGYNSVSTNPCFGADTLVIHFNQHRELVATPIKHLADKQEDVWVPSIDRLTGIRSSKLGRQPRQSGTDRALIRVLLTNGYVDVTPDHVFFDTSNKEYKASELMPGTELPGCQDLSQFVVAVEPINGLHDVYTLTVDDNHTVGIATNITNGIAGIYTTQCGEIILSAYDSCRLICLNLFKMVKNPFTPDAMFDFHAWYNTIRAGMRLSDNLVELELEKLQQILDKVDTLDEKALWSKLINACRNGRRTGLGTLGLADCLAALGIKYGSEEAVELTNAIFRNLKDHAYQESVLLAKERGCFPVYNVELEQNHPFLSSLNKFVLADMQQHGRRNISILTNAPTGSKAIEAQVSSGIEPVFRNEYNRRKKINHNSDAVPDFVDAQGDKWQTFSVLHHNLARYRVATGNSDTPDYFVTSDQLDWNQRLAMQAAVQRHIDHSVSSTINLPRGTTTETVGQIYLEAWKMGLKGVTVYVDGSRDGVLISNDTKSDEITTSLAPKRPAELPCEIYRADVGDDEWTFLVGLLDGKPYEVFAGKNYPAITGDLGIIQKRSFKTVNAKYDLIADQDIYTDIVNLFDDPTEGTLTRMVSMSLRHGVPVQYVVEQLQKDNKDSTMFSFSKVLARVLKRHIPDGLTVKKSCPECKGTLQYTDGCVICVDCGASKC